MPTKSARKSYRNHSKTSKCKGIKRGAVCKRTSGCTLTKKTSKKASYCRKNKNTLRKFLDNFNIFKIMNSKKRKTRKN